MESEQTADLATALAKAQAAIKPAIINKMNPHFKNRYADLAAVREAILQPLADNALSVTQTTELRDGFFVLVTKLRHSSGQWVASEYPLPTNGKPQEIGSAITYARRYSLSAILCIAADDDDDGEAANAAATSKTNGAAASKASPIKPAKQEAPADQTTGEISPHKIAQDEPMRWGQAFVAAINNAKDQAEIDNWLVANSDRLDALEDTAPKIRERLMTRVEQKLKSLEKAAAS
jgi:hypothetical protein